jgi:hypothetical protein
MQTFDVSQVIHSSRNTGLASGDHGDGLAAESVPAGVMCRIVRIAPERTVLPHAAVVRMRHRQR